jgi:hypothetical protein
VSLFGIPVNLDYTLRRDLEPPLDSVMDAFKSEDQNDPTIAFKTHDDLNADLLQTQDSTHHDYVLLAKSDSRLIVIHRLSQYQPGIKSGASLVCFPAK